MQFVCAVVACALVLSGQIINISGQGESCKTPDNVNGLCVVLAQCPSLVQMYSRDSSNQQVVNYMVGAQRSCGSRSVNRNPIVCCAQSLTSGALPRTPVTQPTTPAVQSTREETCRDPNGKSGTCRSIYDCPHILKELTARRDDATYRTYLQESNVICHRTQQNICCTNEGAVNIPISNELKGRLLTPEQGCGRSNTSLSRVVGGHAATMGAWPWMALIGYTNSLKELIWKCGGTLVTSRHVLTAAHCNKITLTTVRLGEHDTSRDDDGAIQDIRVITKESNPNYDSKIGNGDLAVLYLERDADLSTRVTPICLPLTPDGRSRNYEQSNLFIAGWGRTAELGNPSDVLMQVQLPVLSNEVCKDRYRKQGILYDEQKQFNDAVMCAGYLEGGKDSCQGDSGGPLMAPTSHNEKTIFYQVGVISYGIGCARQDVPSVYTRVSTFMDWINEKVADNLSSTATRGDTDDGNHMDTKR